MKPKLGEDIIKAYEPYRNEKAKWKTSIISNQKFEIYDRYEIVDTSMIWKEFSWPRRLRCGRRGKRQGSCESGEEPRGNQEDR